MWRWYLLGLCACGRLAFDATPDAGDSVAPDAAVEPSKVGLGPGGDARAIRAPGTTLSPLYVLFGFNRLVRSDDLGLSVVDCNVDTRYIVAFDADATGRVVVATYDGVLESTDRCATFRHIGLQDWINEIAIDGSTILASVYNGLVRYDGASWVPISSALDGMYYAHDILVGTPALIGYAEGALRSTDGTTWTASSTGLPASTQVLRIHKVASTYYAATSNGMYISTDAGMSWTQRHPAYSDVLAADPTDPMFVVHWYFDGFISSADGGMTWSNDVRVPAMARTRVNDVLFDPAGSSTLLAATGRGLFITDTHALDFRQLMTLDAWTIDGTLRTTNGTRYAWTTAGVLRQLGGSGPITLHDSGGPSFASTFDMVEHAGSIYTAGRNIGVSTTGDTYSEVYLPDGIDAWVIRTIASAGGTLFAGSYGRVLRSTDGTTWTGPTLPVGWINDVLAIPGAPIQVIAATDSQTYYSADGGMTFTAVPLPSFDEVYELLALPDGSVLAAARSGMFHAVSPGAPWTLRAHGTSIVGGLALRGSTLFAIVDDAIMRSPDNGMTWSTVDGFTGRSAHSIEIDPSGDLIIGTGGWGLYRIAVP